MKHKMRKFAEGFCSLALVWAIMVAVALAFIGVIWMCVHLGAWIGGVALALGLCILAGIGKATEN